MRIGGRLACHRVFTYQRTKEGARRPGRARRTICGVTPALHARDTARRIYGAAGVRGLGFGVWGLGFEA